MIERSPNNAREMHFFIYAGLFLLGATETCVSPCFPVVSLALNTVVKSDGGKNSNPGNLANILYFAS